MIGRLPKAAFVAAVAAGTLFSGLSAAAVGSPDPLAAGVAPDATYGIGAADPFDYSDVVLLGNNNSERSRNLTYHFQQVRSVPSNNVLLADLPVGESISEAQWDTFAVWFEGEMANRSLGSDINYIVTFKDMPIRVYWTTPGGPSSFQDALMLLGGSYASFIGNANLYGNPFFNSTARFSFATFGFRLVTGIYAYNESTAMALIDRAANSLGSRGEFVLDADASKGFNGTHGTYAFANRALLWANDSLRAAGWPTYLDTNNTYVTQRTGVMGYSSWGSNDCCWGSVTQVALPHNTWVNGSIGETFVSTGARTFTWPPSYGQSLIADWIDEGANAMKGYTDEPYINAIADGHILHVHYARGYNMAESYWAASHFLGWRQLVVGDPKMAAYADVSNLHANEVYTAAPITAVQDATINATVAVDNIAPVAREVELAVAVGGVEVTRFNASLPARMGATFDVALNLAVLPPATWGNLSLTFTVDPADLVPEPDETDNEVALPLEIRRPPVASASFDLNTIWSGDTAVLTLTASRADRPIVAFEVRSDAAALPTTLLATDNSATAPASFPRSGAHQFWATAIDSAGLRSVEVGPLELLVLNRFPVATASANATSVLSGEPVRLTAAGSLDPDGAIVSYYWAAGGRFSSEADADFIFDRPGSYLVLLTVADDEGATAVANLTIHVRNRAPHASVVPDSTAPLSLTPVEFTGASSFDEDGAIVSYLFEFDDGFVVNSTQDAVIHSFASPGAQGLWLTVTDDWGATARARAGVEVQNRLPSVAWGAGPPAQIAEGVSAVFTANASDLDGALASYTLDFGDGRRATRSLTGSTWAMSEGHTFSSVGSFTVSLTFADDLGGSRTVTHGVVVVHPPPTVSSGAAGIYGGLLTITYAADSPYSGLELVVEVDGSIWRQVAAESSGRFEADITGFPPGNHTVHAYVTDGTESTPVADTTFHIDEPAAQPPPPPPPPSTPGVPGVAIAAALAAAALILRITRAASKKGR